MIQLRPAKHTDLPELANLFLSARRQAFHWCDPEAFQPGDFATQTEGEIIHLAEDPEGRLLGFVSIWLPDSFVHHLYVAPEHQRRGVGTVLLESLPSWLPLPHTLKCLARNLPAIAFYQRHGWVEKDRGRDQLGDYLLMEYTGPADR